MIEIQDNSETIEVPIFKLPKKEVELKVEKPIEEVKDIDPINDIISKIKEQL
jgi:hypothetical protein